MKKRDKLFLLIVATFLSACSSGNQSKDSSDGDGIIRIDPNSRKREKLMLSEIIDSITYIPLETNDKCLLGTIRRDFIYSDNYILVKNTDFKIYLFDKTGSFVAQIGDIGLGPGEYLYYDSYLTRIDEQNGQVIITCLNPRRSMYYDFNGKFIKSIPLPLEDVTGLIEYHKNFYLVKESNYYGMVNYTYTVLDTTFNIITRKITPVQYSLKDGYMALTNGPSFSQYTYNDQVYIRENMLNDTLYLINSDFSFVPKYIINSGKYDVTVDIRSDEAFRFIREVKKNRVVLWSMFETDNFLFILYEYQNKRIPCYYHKKENKVIHIASSSGILNDFDGGLDFWPEYQNNKELVTFYDAYQLVEHKKNANQFKLKGDEAAIRRFDQMIRKLEPDDNPVMVIVTLK